MTLINASCLHWLARSEEGLNILKHLFENVAIVKQISIEVLLNPVFCKQTKEQTTLLSLLNRNTKGRDLLTYLLIKNPELKKQWPEEHEFLNERTGSSDDQKTQTAPKTPAATSSEPAQAEFKETGLVGKNLRLFKAVKDEKDDTTPKPDKIIRITQ